MNLSILYRGPLSSCNYGCVYCPFAKRHETAAELAVDRRALQRFVDWVASRAPDDRIGVLFTPWGEALTRRWYWEALTRLSHLPHVARAAIQTNLSAPLDWIERADTSRLALWVTFHPSEVERATFVGRCQELDRLGVRYSVGVVGLKSHQGEIEALRRELSPNTYLWINAYKRDPDYYSPSELRDFEAIDPLFPINNQRHSSLGRTCRAGRSVVSVDGDGTMRRCHFIREPIGNLYEPGFESTLIERACTNATCSCHIGYVHLDELGLGTTFGPGILERIPAQAIWRDDA
ncbi:STM4011 family radical SAM protein [Singulisphaera sp. Ch08]|uniref:STM4011 family radical SAM protein n=1 Tax=Singulisphaera sp. Ch08 TaxID=3120278 RepID=A0AAU7CTP1_9BACT